MNAYELFEKLRGFRTIALFLSDYYVLDKLEYESNGEYLLAIKISICYEKSKLLK